MVDRVARRAAGAPSQIRADELLRGRHSIRRVGSRWNKTARQNFCKKFLNYA